jgi:hypothetical protein
MNSILAKILGWGQFGLSVLGQVATSGAPHGAFGWLGLAGSLLTAVALHASSNTDGTK